jgi:Zn-finger nucleic acid-binding protein
MPEPTLRCPADGNLMTRLAMKTVSIDHCAKCGGIWLDARELSAVMAVGGATGVDQGPVGRTDKGFAPGGRNCPRDKAALRKATDPDQPHVELDLCGECGGVFLDAGELSDLSELTLRERIGRFLR